MCQNTVCTNERNSIRIWRAPSREIAASPVVASSRLMSRDVSESAWLMSLGPIRETLHCGPSSLATYARRDVFPVCILITQQTRRWNHIRYRFRRCTHQTRCSWLCHYKIYFVTLNFLFFSSWKKIRTKKCYPDWLKEPKLHCQKKSVLIRKKNNSK